MTTRVTSVTRTTSSNSTTNTYVQKFKEGVKKIDHGMKTNPKARLAVFGLTHLFPSIGIGVIGGILAGRAASALAPVNDKVPNNVSNTAQKVGEAAGKTLQKVGSIIGTKSQNSKQHLDTKA